MTVITNEHKNALSKAFAAVSSGIGIQQDPDFPAPTVKEAPSGVLDPLLGTAGIDVVVAYPSMTTSDVIGLFFNGNDTFTPITGSVFGSVTFKVPAADVATTVGKTVRVIYAVVRPDGTIVSQILDLQVSPLNPAQLPAPQITQAAGGILDVNTLTADADVTVAAWPLIAAGQRLWLSLQGSTNLTLPAWQGFAITAPGPQTTKIPATYLKALTHDSTLELVLEVSFDNGATRQTFPKTSYTIKAVPDVTSITITRVTDSKGTPIDNGGTTTDTSVTVYGEVA